MREREAKKILKWYVCFFDAMWRVSGSSMRFAGTGLAGVIMEGNGSKYHGFGAVVCITIQRLLYSVCGMYF